MSNISYGSYVLVFDAHSVTNVVSRVKDIVTLPMDFLSGLDGVKAHAWKWNNGIQSLAMGTSFKLN